MIPMSYKTHTFLATWLLLAAIFFSDAALAPSCAQGVPPTRPAAVPATPAPVAAPAHIASAPATPAPARATPAVATPARAAPAPATSSAVPALLAPIKFNKTDYADLAVFGKKQGFTASWTKTPDTLQLTLKKPGMKLDFTSEHIDFFANGLRVFAGAAIRAYQNSLWMSRVDIDNLLAPIAAPDPARRPVPGLRVIAIDPGHGGDDNGTTNPRLKINEKTCTLDTANRLKTLLEQRGYKVVMTRTLDKYVGLAERPAIATQARADLLVSIHYNAVENPGDAQRIAGVEVYRFTPRNQPPIRRAQPTPADKMANPADASAYWNALAAFQMHRALLAALKVPDRGLRHDKFAVLRLSPIPAILVEPGFLTNDTEARKIMTPAYRQKIAEAIAAGIQAYAAALDTPPKP